MLATAYTPAAVWMKHPSSVHSEGRIVYASNFSAELLMMMMTMIMITMMMIMMMTPQH